MKMKEKILLIADMHGENPVGIVKQSREEVEQVVFLGDYDTPEIVRELRKLRIKKRFIVGNHDLHYVNGLEISGPLMTMPWQKYVKLWKNNPNEKKFIERAIMGESKNAGLILEDKLEDGIKIAYCHGGIVDNGLDASRYVWQRMFSEENIMENFSKIIEEDYWILFRAHDHTSAVISLREKPARLEYPIGERIKLAKTKRHIVKIGPFYYDNYAIFDSNTGILEYKDIKEELDRTN